MQLNLSSKNWMVICDKSSELYLSFHIQYLFNILIFIYSFLPSTKLYKVLLYMMYWQRDNLCWIKFAKVLSHAIF